MSLPFSAKSGYDALPTEPQASPDVAFPHFGDEERRKRRRRRFFHFTACFILLGLLVLHMGPGREIVKRKIAKLKSGCGMKGYAHPPPHEHYYPIPSNIELEDCVESWGGPDSDGPPPPPGVPGRFPHAAFARLKLDLSSDLLFISRGSLSYGNFELLQGEHHHPHGEEDSSDDVKVDLKVEYGRNDFLDIVKVCRITRDDGSKGVGIFTPQWRHSLPRRIPGRGPVFSVRVHLPEKKGGEPLSVHSFETDLPLFKHFVSELDDGVAFDKLLLASANKPITVKSVAGDQVNVTTINAPIFGHFRTNSSIVLKTVNAPIHAHLELHNGDITHATSAEVVTTNSHIDISTNLTASPDNAGNFSVIASTVRGKIHVEFEDAPVDSTLALEAVTALAAIDVHLHPTYQGNLLLETVLDKVTLDDREVEDPAGKGRKRTFDFHRVMRGQLDGRTWWGEDDEAKNLGTVVLKTTLGAINLHL